MAPDPRRPRHDPLVGSAIAIVACLYVLYLVFLLVGGAASWPWWLIALTLLPVFIALAAYIVTIVMEVRAYRRRGRDGPTA